MTHSSNLRNQEPALVATFVARSRSIGYTLGCDGQIDRYGVKTIKGTREGAGFSQRVYQSLIPLLRTIRPGGVIVVERVERPEMYGVLVAVLPQVLQRFATTGYGWLEISLSQVKQRLCNNKRATHQEVIATIAEREAILGDKIKGGQFSRKTAYWTPALMAVALAFAAEAQCVGGNKSGKDYE
jgi:hypothetical protein